MPRERLRLQAGRNIDPSGATADADIVAGYGRCVIEAMAAGRAAYVYDHAGGDGWVTPSTWTRLEAGGFTGRSGLGPIDRDRLLRDLANHSPKMGADNRELARRHHNVLAHAERSSGSLHGPPRRAPARPRPRRWDDSCGSPGPTSATRRGKATA